MQTRYEFVLEKFDSEWIECHRVNFKSCNSAKNIHDALITIGLKDTVIRGIWPTIWANFTFTRLNDYSLELVEAFYPFRVSVRRKQ